MKKKRTHQPTTRQLFDTVNLVMGCSLDAVVVGRRMYLVKCPVNWLIYDHTVNG